MRRTALLVLVVALCALAVAKVESSGREGRARPRPGRHPVDAARRAHELALAMPLVVTLVTSDGIEVARARVHEGRAEVAAGGLTGVQDGGRLHSLGTSVDVPAADPAELLAPLVDRPARWERRHLRLEGSPPARAWLDGSGGLARLEIDLGSESLLVVTPAR